MITANAGINEFQGACLPFFGWIAGYGCQKQIPLMPRSSRSMPAPPVFLQLLKQCHCVFFIQNSIGHVCMKYNGKKSFSAALEQVTLFCSRLRVHRGASGSFVRAIVSHDRPRGEIRLWLEPHGLLRQKLPGEHMARAFC